ncbi:MAG: CRISPR-associated helicase Cas3' [Schleiferilactobacillus perolens]|uniref:CRISPR-associated helicase Cas3' n=1 Tax=Schleiferilactobacillus perolens TaxID=100468 RepID=UPI0039E807A2
MWIAHTSRSGESDQDLSDHLHNVATLAGEYAQPLDLYSTGYLAGLLHDAGKYSDAFQTYMWRIQKKLPVQRGSVDHAYAGAKILLDLDKKNPSTQNNLAMVIIANAIMCHHHPELYDFIDPQTGDSPFEARLDDSIARHRERNREYPEIVTRFHKEICSDKELVTLLNKAEDEVRNFFMQESEDPNQHADTFAWLGRYIYSCLIDADRTDTANFEQQSPQQGFQSRISLQKLAKNLTDTVADFPLVTKTQQQRHEISGTAASHGQQWPRGIYNFTVPTGSGKTLSAMRFALNNAYRNHQPSVIYCAPFISILEQNAASVRLAVKEPSAVLEHHSNIDQSSDESELAIPVLRYRHDAWDSPIVMTTTAGFTNSILDSGSNNIRRFHRLCDSALLIDEPQSLPARLLKLLLSFLRFAVKRGHATVVFMTATQPAFDIISKETFAALPEIIPNYAAYEKQMQRVQINTALVTGDEVYIFSVGTLADYIVEHFSENLLVILNTVSAVQQLTQELTKRMAQRRVTIWTLSTRLCPQHRSDQLQAIRYLLDHQAPVIVVATPIIEAGVDISFKHCLRSLSGMDAIVQAAGRVNREGKDDEIGDLTLIRTSFENMRNLSDVETRTEITQKWLSSLEMPKTSSTNQVTDANNILSSAEQREFFESYYCQAKRERIVDYPVSSGQQTVWLYDLLNDGDYPSDSHESLHYTYYQKHGYYWPYYYVPAWSTLSHLYQYIDDAGKRVGVLVPYNTDARQLIDELSNCRDPAVAARLLKRAQKYTVNVFPSVVKNDNRIISVPGFKNQILQLNPQDSNAYLSIGGLNL